MLWAILTILAVILWAISNIIDKFVLTKYLRKAFLPLIILSFLGVFFSIGILAVNFVIPEIWLIIFSLISGLLYGVNVFFYFKAMQIEEASRVVPLYSLNAIFVSILAFIFLGENFETAKYFGIALLILGAFMISVKRNLRLRNPKAVLFMITGGIFWSAHLVTVKMLTGFIDYWIAFAYIRIGVFLWMLPLIYLYIPELIKTVKEHGKKAVVVIGVSETLAIIGLVAITAALSFGPATLVGAMNETQPMFAFMFITFIGLFFPKVIKEEIGWEILFVKAIAIILIIAGSIILL